MNKSTTTNNNVVKPRKFFIRVVISKKNKVRFEYLMNSRGKAVKLINATCMISGDKIRLNPEETTNILYDINDWNGYNFKHKKSDIMGIAMLVAGCSAFQIIGNWAYNR